ncbi:hypothetical protein E2C01_055913 [Portunus trituberculatus]|uniref:Uncharacterized protein n=1 Tax=Portunus trituberculatus TaxID=210409 RepID=A0A5B7GW01_PORTR|nr:hypothetical protein [Portunus trituberculatus]
MTDLTVFLIRSRHIDSFVTFLQLPLAGLPITASVTRKSQSLRDVLLPSAHFYAASERYVGIKIQKTVTTNLLTSMDPS